MRARFFLALLGVSVALLLSEVILQCRYRLASGSWHFLHRDAYTVDYVAPVSDRREYALLPNFQDDRISINSQGFRGREINLSAKEALVCFLGDSVPFGAGVRESETYPAQFQRLLEGAGIPAQVVNAGVPSYNLRQAFDRLRLDVLPRKLPAVVVIQAGNDVALLTHYRERWNSDRTWASVRWKIMRQFWWFRLLGRSAGFYYLSNLFSGATDATPKAPPEVEQHTRYPPSELLGHVKSVLQENLRFLQSLHSKVVLLPNNPFYYQTQKRELNDTLPLWARYKNEIDVWHEVIDEYNTVLAETAAEFPHARFFDARAFLDNIERAKMYLDFIHLTPLGNQELAQALFDFINQSGFLAGQSLASQ